MRRKGPKKKSKNSTHSFKILKPYTLHPYLKKKKKKKKNFHIIGAFVLLLQEEFIKIV